MKKILLGMSGGVDSTVAAILLKNKGWQVIGATLDLLPESGGDTIKNARESAKELGIEHHVLDFKDEFRKNVIDDFICKYTCGKTPSPCIECNRHIKFGAFLKYAEDMGIEYIATGHYAKTEYDEKTGRYLLKKADCTEKDQSYMLYTLSQHQLSKCVFPLQNLTKDQVRKIAAENNLSAGSRGDSQEICFVPDDDHIRFLSDNMEKELPQGDFVDKDGNVLGKHQGIHRYTVGQRKGLGIAFGKPMFVTGIDAKNNQVVLGESGSEYSDFLIAERVNFIPFEKLTEPIFAQCKVRYGNKYYGGIITPLDEDKIRIDFETPARAVTPGQSVVFYNSDTVIGGGIIL